MRLKAGEGGGGDTMKGKRDEIEIGREEGSSGRRENSCYTCVKY